METKTILVTGIGGNVGQGIIRNLRTLNYNITIVGTNINPLSSGNHMVDAFYEVPYGYDPDFIPSIDQIINKEKIDLIIPSTDFETNILAENAQLIQAIIACAGKKATSIYLDKYLSFLFHQKYNIPFAESCLPSEFQEQFSPAIAKPRKGRGSKGLIMNYIANETLNDDEYIIQKMYKGKELTTAVYVSYITREFIGMLTMERTLENGTTTFCKVVKQYDKTLEKIARDIIANSDIKGSFNIQSIATEQAQIYPFEVNCRISGTNSIRSHFGFEDVKYTVNELLYNKIPSNIKIKDGTAFRFLTDVVYTEDIKSGTSSDNFIVF